LSPDMVRTSVRPTAADLSTAIVGHRSSFSRSGPRIRPVRPPSRAVSCEKIVSAEEIAGKRLDIRGSFVFIISF